MHDEMKAGDVVASTTPQDTQEAGFGCGGCASRRDFLKGGAVAALGLLATLGLGSGAAALPVRAARLLRSTAGAKTYAIPVADGVDIDRDEGVILVRWKGEVIAFNLSCPHQNTALRWNESAQRFQCPKHHSQYTPEGEFITGRATRGMDRFPIRRQGSGIVVDIDHMLKQTDDPAAWQAAVVKV